MAKRNYYEVLGVANTASEAEIKSAYRRWAHKLHPDKSPGDTEIENAFKELNEANEILSNAAKRRAYDLLNQPADSVATLYEVDPEGRKVMDRELPHAPAAAQPGADRATVLIVPEAVIKNGGVVTVKLERADTDGAKTAVELSLNVPPGHRVARIHGLGEIGVNGGPQGDAYLFLRP